ncbi:hypothetical protein L1N85_06865 [Paenibacillus alkaliterrae]|uniref:hypothetical protein n=1 Tax=Paenibacillus alkaliterrae TaxID=320909 RepID=UPI001F3FD875|nr:hypothetical protein [Paenibacillus alkaliterrae]MCF2938154.1 hypothetical protein [Paenibacillus alkaliterrae]
MINHSFNQFLNAQSAEQYHAMLKEKEINLTSLSNNIRSLTSKNNLAYLELEKTKQLVRYYSVQQYYRVVSMKNSLEAVELEAAYLEQGIEDAVLLNKHGLVSEIELDKVRNEWGEQNNEFERLLHQYEAQVERLKSELGIAAEQKVQIDSIEVGFPENTSLALLLKLDENYELRRADEEIRSAKEIYDELLNKDLFLAGYYLNAWNRKKEEKEIVKKQLEQLLKQMEYEGQALYKELEQLSQKQSEIVQTEKDHAKLLAAGRITTRDVEDLKLKMDLLRLNVENAKLNYVMFQVKQQLAVKGVLIKG